MNPSLQWSLTSQGLTFPRLEVTTEEFNLHQRHRTGEDHEVREATTKGASRHRKRCSHLQASFVTRGCSNASMMSGGTPPRSGCFWVPGPNGTSPSWIYDNAPVLSNSARLAPDFESVLLDEEVLEQMEEGDAWGIPPTTTLLMLGQVHLEKWSLGVCGMHWRNHVGRCWEGKNPTWSNGSKWRMTPSPSVVFRKLTQLFMPNECLGLIGLRFCACST